MSEIDFKRLFRLLFGYAPDIDDEQVLVLLFQEYTQMKAELDLLKSRKQMESGTR